MSAETCTTGMAWPCVGVDSMSTLEMGVDPSWRRSTPDRRASFVVYTSLLHTIVLVNVILCLMNVPENRRSYVERTLLSSSCLCCGGLTKEIG
jgi:hypothetical protein